MEKNKLNAMLELDKYSHDYKVKLTQQEALDFISVADCYNHMTPYLLTNLVTELNNYVQEVQNKFIEAYYEVGKEHSRVIYLHISKPFKTNPGTTTKSNNIKVQNKALIAFAKLAKSANVDEFYRHLSNYFEVVYRFWWD